MMTGGISSARPATKDIQEMCLKVQKLNDLFSYSMFKAIEYRSQVVAGINFLIKVQVDQNGSCVFLRVFQSLPKYDREKLEAMHLTQKEEIEYLRSTQELTLTSIKGGYTLSSVLN